MGSDAGKGLAEWLIRIIELGCDGLEVEYRSGYEEITAMKGNFGLGIDRIKSSSRKAAALRDELWSLRNRTKRIEVQGTVYKARVRALTVSNSIKCRARGDSRGEAPYRYSALIFFLAGV